MFPRLHVQTDLSPNYTFWFKVTDFVGIFMRYDNDHFVSVFCINQREMP